MTFYEKNRGMSIYLTCLLLISYCYKANFFAEQYMGFQKSRKVFFSKTHLLHMIINIQYVWSYWGNKACSQQKMCIAFICSKEDYRNLMVYITVCTLSRVYNFNKSNKVPTTLQSVFCDTISALLKKKEKTIRIQLYTFRYMAEFFEK